MQHYTVHLNELSPVLTTPKWPFTFIGWQVAKNGRKIESLESSLASFFFLPLASILPSTVSVWRTSSHQLGRNRRRRWGIFFFFFFFQSRSLGFFLLRGPLGSLKSRDFSSSRNEKKNRPIGFVSEHPISGLKVTKLRGSRKAKWQVEPIYTFGIRYWSLKKFKMMLNCKS